MPARPPMIMTNSTNPFALNTMKVRVPRTTRDVMALNPDYPASILAALEQLAVEIENDAPIPRLNPLTPDYDLWQPAYDAHAGHTWQNTDWFFAEIYFYRYLIQTVRWWETGRDPFAPKKVEELANDRLWTLLDDGAKLKTVTTEERLYGLIHYDIWGNRIDLSFAPSLEHGHAGTTEDLLVDDSTAVTQHLLRTGGTVHIVADNTGTEMAMDLALSDFLLDDPTRQVVIHLKMHPTFVSDATVTDVWHLIDGMETETRTPAVNQMGSRLRHALNEGRLRLAPDFYWNSTILFWDLPDRLRQIFTGAALVIIKGDANYRRIVGDAVWQPDVSFDEVIGEFPAPLLALRTLKSDPIVGLRPGLAAELDVLDPQWHVNGKRGVIQFKPR